MYKSKKQFNRSIVDEWIKKLDSKASSKYYIREKLQNEGCKNIDEILDGMTNDQIRAVRALLVAGYNNGCSDTREHFIEMREDQKRYNKE